MKIADIARAQRDGLVPACWKIVATCTCGAPIEAWCQATTGGGPSAVATSGWRFGISCLERHPVPPREALDWEFDPPLPNVTRIVNFAGEESLERAGQVVLRRDYTLAPLVAGATYMVGPDDKRICWPAQAGHELVERFGVTAGAALLAASLGLTAARAVVALAYPAESHPEQHAACLAALEGLREPGAVAARLAACPRLSPDWRATMLARFAAVEVPD